MTQGYFSLILHAHLPFVRHPEREDLLEERWLFEAITDTYIPLLQVFQGLVSDGVPFRATMSLTPTLLSMLSDNLLQERYDAHISRLIELSAEEVFRTADSPQYHVTAREYLNRFSDIRAFYRAYNGNIVRAFRELQDSGNLETITCAATHAFLPLVSTKEAIRAQIETAVQVHVAHLGRRPKGIWLPECGYRPGIDEILRDAGIEFFFVDTHGLLTASPTPRYGTFSPILTPAGVAAFGRDAESSKQVWSSKEGYPGDFDYREWYRDIGFDLPIEYLEPYLPEGKIRVNTGIKYHRITGLGDHKEPYNLFSARDKAKAHAAHFLNQRKTQVESVSKDMDRDPIVTAPFDAELFGHWWYEGPLFLDALFRNMHKDRSLPQAITPSEYLNLYNDYQVCEMGMSSWGRGGYADVWLRGENDWIYPALHKAEEQMVQLANQIDSSNPFAVLAANQAARELMLAESSDFAFIMDNKTMVDYAVKRTKYHINRFNRLYSNLLNEKFDEETRTWLESAEELSNLFPDIDYRAYQSRSREPSFEEEPRTMRVLMLSWEFPPMTVGGLSRHVYDLSRFLVQAGIEVHVLTTQSDASASYELVEGIHVHRVHVLRPDGGEFVHWAFQLNLMLIDACRLLQASGITFDLIHAHDWLVCYAAKTLKEQYNLPLIATIHATEHGRNNGIHTDLQRYIHRLEWELSYEAWRVIVCSQYMLREVETVLDLPSDKIDVLPNGVEPRLLKPQLLRAQPDVVVEAKSEIKSKVKSVVFLGRLVREKGVHVLLRSVPEILSEFPEVKFFIVGNGSYRGELENLTHELCIEQSVVFTGFVSDQERNRILSAASVAVFPSLYEPFGIVALEAMAAETPVVVSDVGGLGDVVDHGRNGLKMRPGDAHSCAVQVCAILRDEAFAQKLAATGMAEIDRYDWSKIAEQTVNIYTSVLNQRGAIRSGISISQTSHFEKVVNSAGKNL